jgi:hypothetical protein
MKRWRHENRTRHRSYHRSYRLRNHFRDSPTRLGWRCPRRRRRFRRIPQASNRGSRRTIPPRLGSGIDWRNHGFDSRRIPAPAKLLPVVRDFPEFSRVSHVPRSSGEAIPYLRMRRDRDSLLLLQSRRLPALLGECGGMPMKSVFLPQAMLPNPSDAHILSGKCQYTLCRRPKTRGDGLLTLYRDQWSPPIKSTNGKHDTIECHKSCAYDWATMKPGSAFWRPFPTVRT